MWAQSTSGPFTPQLQRVFEAQCAWMHGRLLRRLSHQQTDQVVREEMHPDFLFVHLGCVAAQFRHLQGGFDGAQVKLHVPALAKQGSQGGFRDLARPEEAGTRIFLPTLTSRNISSPGNAAQFTFTKGCARRLERR